MSLSPEQVIRKEYGNSTNFVTSIVMEYGWIIEGVIAYELSGGRFLGERLRYGITIVELNTDGTTRPRRDLSKLLDPGETCDSYVEQIRKDLTS